MTSVGLNSFSLPYTPIPTIDQKLASISNYPIDHLSMGLVHFADLWFGLKTALSNKISNEVKYQIYFAAHAHRNSDGLINFGEDSDGYFNFQGLNPKDLALLYHILHAYYQHEKSHKKPEEAIFGHHLKLIENHLKKICSSDVGKAQEIIHAFVEQDEYHQLLDIREKLVVAMTTKVEEVTPVDFKEVAKLAFARAAADIQISQDKLMRHISWETREVPINLGTLKMQVNAIKSICEHKKAHFSAPYINAQELNAILDLPYSKKILQLTYSEFEAKGIRPTMEDTHFFTEFKGAALAGIFDGHGGSKIAKIAKKRFEMIFMTQFCQILEEDKNKNFHKTFEKAIAKLQEEIAADSNSTSQGCTATIVFILKEEHLVFTANLGDSEARIYTKINEQNRIIPLSCIRDWSSKFDATRASVVENDPMIVNRYVHAENPKALRLKGTLNVSRALGDLNAKGKQAIPGIIHKPKITMQRIPDPKVYGPSVLVIGCDGLWDYAIGSYDRFSRPIKFVKFPLREAFLAEMVMNNATSSTLATMIGNQALRDWKSLDNVSVLTLAIE